MKNKTTKRFLIGVFVSVIIIVIAIASIYLLTQQSTFTTEVGWIPFTSLDNQFTDLNRNFVISSAQGLGFDITDSKYWKFTGTSGLWTTQCEITGGDSSATFVGYTGGSKSYQCSGGEITFKENLYNKIFAINYKTSGNNGNYLVMGEKLGLGSGLIELKPNILDETKSDLYINGIKAKTIQSQNKELYLKFTTDLADFNSLAKITLINPRWKPLFDCEINSDEVLVFDEFSEGSTFNLNSLSYPVNKLCLNQPASIRSFKESGIAVDTDGQILTTLRDGGSITVKAKQTIRIPYITKYDSTTLRCGLNEAYSTVEKKCINMLSEPTTIDVPSTKIDVISVGERELLYTQSSGTNALLIGKLSLDSTEPEYICDCSQAQNLAYIYPSNTNANCWMSQVNNKATTYGSTFDLNQYISVQYTISGDGIYKGTTSSGITYNCEYKDGANWQNVFKITVSPDFLQIKPKDAISTVLLNSDKHISFIVINGVSDFSNSGFMVTVTKKLVDTQTTVNYIATPILLNSNTYSVKVPTDSLGKATVEIVPYAEIQGKKIFSGTKLVANYEVVSSLTTTNASVITNSNETVSQETLPKVVSTQVSSKTILGIIVMICVVVALIFFVVYLVYKKK